MQRALTAVAALALLALSVRVGARMEPGLDYFSDAGGAIDALARWDLEAFLAEQPLMGSFSLLLRAPFVTAVFHESESVVYLAGALPCLLATVALGLVLSRMLADRGQPPAVQGLALGLAVLNPLTFRALHWGHPEELLAGALCVGAVLAALRERQLAAGVLLGLAVATKQWAVLAILPALVAAPGRRLALATVAGGVAALLTLPLLLGNPEQFAGVAESASGQDPGGAMTTPWNVWWPFSSVEHLADGRGPYYVGPAWVATVSHPLIVLAALPLSLLLWRRRDRRPDDALLLLALLFLLRCLLDNWNNDYYHVPFLLSLLAWETVRRPGVPRLTLAAGLLLALTFFPYQTQIFAGSFELAPVHFAVYVGWAVPLAAGLALLLYRPAAAAAAVERMRPAPRRRAATARP